MKMAINSETISYYGLICTLAVSGGGGTPTWTEFNRNLSFSDAS